MNKNEQQHEALRFFRSNALQWKEKAEADSSQEVNIIQQRNNFVFQLIANSSSTRSFLDVGCGTGDLVNEVARLGIDSTGVDFAPEMIAIARAKAQEHQLKHASFHTCSIFDFEISTRKFDIISAIGFIEYISYEEMNRFLELSWQALQPDGSLILGSRNRLFNMFSLNNYTIQELSHHTVLHLLQEAIALASGIGLTALMEMTPAPQQDIDINHVHTGIDVSTRYQFTPVQLMKLLHEQGFVPLELYPIHIHGVPPAFKETYPEVHTSISNLLQHYAKGQTSLIPFSSSFMLHVRKVIK